MPQRLHGPVKRLAKVNGPVAIGVFEDGTILVAGPNDKPMLFRHGGAMELVEAVPGGDYEFQFMKQDRAPG